MEVTRTPMNLRFYAGEATRTTGRPTRPPAAAWCITLREPVGIVGAITPWNFPLNIPSRKLGPALAAGNPVLFKPSEVTPLMGQRLVEALLEGGLPPGAIALVQGDGAVGAAVAADPRVDGGDVHRFHTGGPAIHGQVGPDRRVQLEMGGKNPVVVAADADLDAAAALIVKGAFGLSGQACTGTSRVIAVDAVHDELLERRGRRKAEALRVGPGPESGVDMGPLASAAQREKFLDYVGVGVEEGATLRCGGPTTTSAIAGFFVRPAVFCRHAARRCALFARKSSGRCSPSSGRRHSTRRSRSPTTTEFGLSAAIVTHDLAAARTSRASRRPAWSRSTNRRPEWR